MKICITHLSKDISLFILSGIKASIAGDRETKKDCYIDS